MSAHPIEPVDQKSVRELNQIHRQEYTDLMNRQYHEMGEAIKREFPVGTKVQYSHGSNQITAVVVELSKFEWKTEQVTVQNKKSGSKRDIEAWRRVEPKT